MPALRAPSLELLEPRVLLHADGPGPVPLLADFTAGPEQAICLDLDPDRQGPTFTPEAGGSGDDQIVFVDPDIYPDSQSTSAEIPGVTVVVLDPARDGIRQIADVLSAYHRLAAIHVLSHGASGQVNLGTARLTLGSLAARAPDLARWGRSLREGGDILFYGCSVAQGRRGADLLDRIADLTHADVAASDDPTGAARCGGDWVLEEATGPLELAPLSPRFAAGLPGLLAAGDLDPSFGTGGIGTVPIGPGDDQIQGVALQPDGKIVAVGYSHNGSNYDFAVARFHPDGTLDTSFGAGGKVTTALGSSDDQASSVALQADGKIVVAGYTKSGKSWDFAVVRYNANGTLDPSFSGDGIQITALSSANDQARSVALQVDGKIVVAGYSRGSGNNNDFALVRYNPDGALDTTFTGDGIQITPIGSSDEQINSVMLQPDGKIVAAGYGNFGGQYDFIVARYQADGTLDPSFSGDGIQTTVIGPGTDIACSVALTADGKIVVAGYSTIGDSPVFVLARYNANGTLDLSFSGDGMQTTAVGAVSRGFAVAVQADGKIVVVGSSSATLGGNDCLTLVRYNSDGTLDPSFSGDGIQTTVIGSSSSIGFSAALQADGKIVVGGHSGNGRDLDFVLARYEGRADTVPPEAPVITGISDDTGTPGDGITSDNRLVLTGTAEANSRVEVSVDGVAAGTTITDDLGAWSFDYTGTLLADGTHAFTATATDAAGNASGPSRAFLVVVDTMAPVVTVNPWATTDRRPALTGTVDDPTATIEVTLLQHTYPAVNQGDGTWSLPPEAVDPILSVGVYEVLVQATDRAGGTGVDLSTNELTVYVPCDMNWDGMVSIVGDIQPFVRVVYFGDCDWYEQNFPGRNPVLPGDGNGDGVLSIVGDVAEFVEAVYFGRTPGPAATDPVFARFPGRVDPSDSFASVNIAITPAGFALNRAGTVDLGLHLYGTGSGAFDPDIVEILDPQGRPVPSLYARADLPGRPDSLTLCALPCGLYQLRIRGQGGSTGDYCLEVFLLGDADGDRNVDGNDLLLLQGAYGSQVGTEANDHSPVLAEADADGDGLIGSFDLARQVHNLGAMIIPAPLSLTAALHPAPTSETAEGVPLTDQPSITVMGRTRPGLFVVLDVDGDGYDDGAVPATGAGTYAFSLFTLNEGMNNLRVRVVDDFGQACEVPLQVVLRTRTADPSLLLFFVR